MSLQVEHCGSYLMDRTSHWRYAILQRLNSFFTRTAISDSAPQPEEVEIDDATFAYQLFICNRKPFYLFQRPATGIKTKVCEKDLPVQAAQKIPFYWS